jgi:hypothetical protein
MEHGYIPIAEDGIDKIKMGVTDLEEVVHTIDMTEKLKDVSLFL